MSPLLREFRDKLLANPNQKWGFVVYRCTYLDDAAWQSFMYRLKLQTKLNLEADDATELDGRIDWAVQEDPSLDGADAKMVKDKFRKWIAEQYPNRDGGARIHGAIMVDKASLDSIDDERTPAANQFDDLGWSWVWMVSSEAKEKTTKVGISYLLPRAYLLLQAIGWGRLVTEDNSVATP